MLVIIYFVRKNIFLLGPYQIIFKRLNNFRLFTIFQKVSFFLPNRAGGVLPNTIAYMPDRGSIEFLAICPGPGDCGVIVDIKTDTGN